MDKEIKKSIELGFEGKLTPEFYAKWKFTHKKRMQHLFELLGFIALLFLFLYLFFILDTSKADGITDSAWDIVDYTKIIITIFIIACLVAIYKNIMAWIDMFHIIKERFDEYAKKR